MTCSTTHHDIVMVSPAAPGVTRALFGLGEHRKPGKNAEAACRMGLEGSVSKHRERVYRPVRCDYWVKVKSREHHGRLTRA